MAENTFQKASITASAAQRIIAAAELKAIEMGRPNTPHLQLENATERGGTNYLMGNPT